MASVGLNATCSRSPPGSKPASHPFALAILARAKSEGLAAPAVECGAALGKGVSGRIDEQDLLLGSVAAAGKRGPMTTPQLARAGTLYDEGKTISVLVVGAEAAGLIAMRDEPRADAKAGIEALSALGVASLMLTGNNDRTAAAIARGLGIELRAGLLPQDKQRIVRELQGNGSIVAKIGDGINDAPALAAANVGIAMGGGTDVALETADAAVLHGRVIDVARMVALSRRTMANIRQNIADRARSQCGVPGDDDRRDHRPLARHSGRHRRDRARHRERAAAAAAKRLTWGPSLGSPRLGRLPRRFNLVAFANGRRN